MRNVIIVVVAAALVAGTVALLRGGDSECDRCCGCPVPAEPLSVEPSQPTP